MNEDLDYTGRPKIDMEIDTDGNERYIAQFSSPIAEMQKVYYQRAIRDEVVSLIARRYVDENNAKIMALIDPDAIVNSIIIAIAAGAAQMANSPKK